MTGAVSSPSVTETAAFTVLRAVLMDYLPAGTEIIRGQDNRVPEPPTSNFLVMTSIAWGALVVPWVNYAGGPALPQATVLAPAEWVVQLDIHGPQAAENADTIQALTRTPIWTEAFAAITPDIAPLYCDPPRQSPFENAESQYERRWMIDMHMQVNPALSVSQGYADQPGPIATILVPNQVPTPP